MFLPIPSRSVLEENLILKGFFAPEEVEFPRIFTFAPVSESSGSVPPFLSITRTAAAQ